MNVSSNLIRRSSSNDRFADALEFNSLTFRRIGRLR